MIRFESPENFSCLNHSLVAGLSLHNPQACTGLHMKLGLKDALMLVHIGIRHWSFGRYEGPPNSHSFPLQASSILTCHEFLRSGLKVFAVALAAKAHAKLDLSHNPLPSSSSYRHKLLTVGMESSHQLPHPCFLAVRLQSQLLGCCRTAVSAPLRICAPIFQPGALK